MEFLPKEFKNKNNECGYVKWAYAKYKTTTAASLNSILRMVPERNVAVKNNLSWNLLNKQQMMLWTLYHQNELLGEFSTQTTRIM